VLALPDLLHGLLQRVPTCGHQDATLDWQGSAGVVAYHVPERWLSLLSLQVKRKNLAVATVKRGNVITLNARCVTADAKAAGELSAALRYC
jgi:hypothetical protein